MQPVRLQRCSDMRQVILAPVLEAWTRKVIKRGPISNVEYLQNYLLWGFTYCCRMKSVIANQFILKYTNLKISTLHTCYNPELSFEFLLLVKWLTVICSHPLHHDVSYYPRSMDVFLFPCMYVSNNQPSHIFYVIQFFCLLFWPLSSIWFHLSEFLNSSYYNQSV